jgi:DNA-binding phage protein
LSDPATAFRFGAAIARRRTVTEAARLAGVSRSAAYRWLALSRDGDARFAGLAEVVLAQRMPFDFLFTRFKPKAVFAAVDDMMRQGEI